MNLLFVSHEASRSGAPVLLRSFLRWLVERTDATIEILLLRDGPLRTEFEQLGRTFTVDELNCRHGWHARVLDRFHRGDEAFWLERACRVLAGRSRYDAVYGNTVVSLPWVAKMTELSGAGGICHLHEMAWAIEQFFPPAFAADILSRLDAIVACSPAVAADLRDLFAVDPARITVVDSFVNAEHPVETPPQAVREALGLPSEAIIIGGVGRAETRKGVDLMVMLLDRLVHRGTSHDFRAVWVGTTPGDPALSTCRHDLRKLGLADRFTFVEQTPRPNDYINAFDIFAMTSREEPMGMAALDAACLGRPVVAFDRASGIAAILNDDRGHVVPYLDVDAMADAVLEVLADLRESSRRAHRMRDEVLRRYTLDVGAPALHQVVQGVVKR